MTSGIGTSLHAHFHLRNQQAFQRLLASNNASSGGGDSTHFGGMSLGSSPRSFKSKAGRDEDKPDINARDCFGRTVLHLASASVDASSVEYVRLLLKHPEINVNLQDWESQWTALHRAMYVGNLGVVLLLLQHSNTDASLKDLEGYTAFDLYNSTVEGTKPESSLFPASSTLSPIQNVNGAELFTWGANRNASLGHGDSSDRNFPDQVSVPRTVSKSTDNVPVEDRFARIGVRQVKMGRLHTAIISESPSDTTLSLCGFGSGGRLGVTQHTQYALRPLSWAAVSQAQSTGAKASIHSRIKVIAVALGQDHTLALSENGELYSWGLNRFSQLGYNIDDGSSAAHVFSLDDPSEFISHSTLRTDSTISSNGEQIQLIPRRVYGPLKKEFVLGVAASKSASACWVREGSDGASGGSNVYTWGLNGGQLGYDRTTTGFGAQVQVIPRKVTKITRPVVQIALGESAMACLLSGVGSIGGGWKGDVLVFWGDQVGRVSFPTHSFPLPISPYRPPQALTSTRIVKIVCSDESPPSFSLSSISTSSGVPTIASTHAQSSHTSSSSLSTMLNSQSNTMNPNQNHISFACVSEGGEVFTFGVPGVPPVGVLNFSSGDADADGSGGSGMALAKIIKPQRVWALRRGIVGAVRDVAIGNDGSLIVCTDSGHVYVRARSSDTNFGGGLKSFSGGKSQRFTRIPFLQRIVGVTASSTGAFGALRVDADIKPIRWPIVDEELLARKRGRELEKAIDTLKGWDLIHDMKSIRPWMRKDSAESPLDAEWLEDSSETSPKLTPPSVSAPPQTLSVPLEKPDDVGDYDDDGDLNIRQDIQSLRELCSFLSKQDENNFGSCIGQLSYGADLMVQIHAEPSVANVKKGRSKFKASSTTPRLSLALHAFLLGMRSNAMATALLSNSESVFQCKADARSAGSIQTISVSPLRRDEATLAPRTIIFTNFHPLAVLILMHYIYTDELICIWDRRVSTGFVSFSSPEALKVTPALATQIKTEMQTLARVLVLPEMEKAMESVAKRLVTETLRADLAAAWNLHNSGSTLPSLHAFSLIAPDIVLQLADGQELFAHSVVLRARSAYFEDFLSEEEWTRKRKSSGNLLKIDLQHMKSGVMEYVMKWLCCGQTQNLFGSLEFAQSVDTVLEFMFEVIAVANELLLFPLVLLTSQLILKFLNIHNACYILSEASHYQAHALVTSVESYISENLETFLESHMLDVLSPSLIKHLSAYIRTRQEEKSSVVRSNKLVNHAMRKWQEWLDNEDIPNVIIPRSLRKQRERKLSQTAKLSSPPSSSPVLSTSFGQKDRGKSTPSSPVFRPRITASPGLKPQAPIPEADDIFDMDDMDIGLPGIPSVEPRPPANRLSSGPTPAWKASSIPRVDMRSVMAEAASASEVQQKSTQNTAVQVRASPNDGSSSSNPVRLRHAGSTLELSSTPSPSRPSGTSWKVPSVPRSGSATQNAFPVLGSSPTPISRSNDSVTPFKTRPPLKDASSGPAGPILGPVFSPARQPTPKAQASTSRRVSSNSVKSTPKAWVATPVHEPLPPTLTNTNGKGMSFVAIQQLQLEQGTNKNDKRSLLEIQQEEQAKREEEDFLKWWNAEEERVRLETEAMERMQTGNDQGQQGGKSQNQKSQQQKKLKKGKAPSLGKDSGNGDTVPGSTSSPGRLRSADVHPTQTGSGQRSNPRRGKSKKGPPAPPVSTS